MIKKGLLITLGIILLIGISVLGMGAVNGSPQTNPDWVGVSAVYIDSISGLNGNTGAIGTPNYPVKNWKDAKIIAKNHATSTFYLIHGSIKLDTDSSGFSFIGNGYRDIMQEGVENVIQLNDKTLTKCTFKEINIATDLGLYTGTLDQCGPFINCGMIRADKITWCRNFQNCQLIAANYIESSDNFYDCFNTNFIEMKSTGVFYNCNITSFNMVGGHNFNNCTFQVDSFTLCYAFYNCPSFEPLLEPLIHWDSCYKFINCPSFTNSP